MTTTYAPILLFVYNRPQHVCNVVQSLLQNALAAESDIFIYSDAPKSETDGKNVAEVREYIRTIKGFKTVTLIKRTENWGLARSIIDGVTTQVNRFGRVIVMEDDLIAAPYFLQFMNDALEAYKDEPRVGHIQGCDFTQDTSLPDTFLIKCSRGHIIDKESDHLKGRRVPFFQLDIDCRIVNHFYGINIICL